MNLMATTKEENRQVTLLYKQQQESKGYDTKIFIDENVAKCFLLCQIHNDWRKQRL